MRENIKGLIIGTLYYLTSCFVSTIVLIFFLLGPIVPKKLSKFTLDILFRISQFPVLLSLFNKNRKVILYTNDEIGKSDPCILIANHQGSVDVIAIDSVLSFYGRLEHVRALFKLSLFFIPIIGPALFSKGLIPLTRSKHRGDDLKFIRVCMNNLLSYCKDFVMIVFAEGTRRNPLLSKTFENSDKLWLHQDPSSKLTRWVTCPKFRGFDELRSSCGRDLKSIYDITIMYRGHPNENKDPTKFIAPGFLEFANNPDIEIHILLKRYSPEDFEAVSTDKEATSNTSIFRLFQEKDEVMETFYKLEKLPVVSKTIQIPFDYLTFIIGIAFHLINFIVMMKFGVLKYLLATFILYAVSLIKILVQYRQYIF